MYLNNKLTSFASIICATLNQHKTLWINVIIHLHNSGLRSNKCI